MLRFLLQRLAAVLPVLLVVSVVVFLILRLAPGDPAAVIAGNSATTQEVEMVRAQLGLTKPIVVQYGIWLGHVLQGDLGFSYYLTKPVTALIAQRIEPTLALAFGTIVLAVLVAVPLGTLAAWRMGGWLDRLLSGFSVLGFSVPGFVIGYCLIYVFAIELGWLPVQGYVRIGVNFWGFLERMVLPSLTLSVGFIALISRITRASVLEVLNEDYIRTARAKGLSNRVVLMRHALRNAAVPILTVIGIGIAILMGGAVITESVFGLPGLGRLTVEAVLSRDFPTIQTVILMFSVVYVVINLLIDISYTLFDPRIRY